MRNALTDTKQIAWISYTLKWWTRELDDLPRIFGIACVSNPWRKVSQLYCRGVATSHVTKVTRIFLGFHFYSWKFISIHRIQLLAPVNIALAAPVDFNTVCALLHSSENNKSFPFALHVYVGIHHHYCATNKWRMELAWNGRFRTKLIWHELASSLSGSRIAMKYVQRTCGMRVKDYGGYVQPMPPWIMDRILRLAVIASHIPIIKAYLNVGCYRHSHKHTGETY